nr:nucleotide-binding alpha-beta plait domain-containing protein [Tanacetum cinerariifolium]
MGSYHSKEDDVSKISTLIYVTNFPKTFSAKDLFHSCKVYGHVVDSFIPLKRSKDGKRFGFVRFINVFSVERLVSNLCTIWVDRFKLHANVAHFNRPHMKDHPSFARKGPEVEHDRNSIGQASKIANSDSIGHGRFKKSVAPCNGGSILSLMEEVVRVGQTMGYKMEGCVNNIIEIIESQGVAEGYR